MMLIRTEIKPSSAFILFNFSPAGMMFLCHPMMLITRRKKKTFIGFYSWNFFTPAGMMSLFHPALISSIHFFH
jgi:hypothetical protein